MSKFRKIIKNWWEYYFVKWGIRGHAVLKIKLTEGLLSVDLNRENFQQTKFFIKTLLSLRNSFQYFAGSNSQLFMIKVAPGVRFLARKGIVNDIAIIGNLFVQQEYACLYPYIKDSVVLDIGAYIGDSSVLFCSKGARKIYAYEPHHELYQLAISNIKLNNLKNKIEIFNRGVGSKKETLEIKEELFGPTSCFGGLGYQGKNIKINILPFAEILNIGKIDVIKMDCEGAEFDAILSCPPELLSKVKAILLEYHKDPVPLIDYFNKAGFKISKIGQEFKGVGLLLATKEE